MSQPTITIQNHGPLIVATDYWTSDYAAAGVAYLSINAGGVRLLVPHAQRDWINEMRVGAKHVVVSVLPADKWVAGQFCVEWMVEDGSQTPWSCQLSPAQIDRCPSADDVGQPWVASVWDDKRGRPHKCLERPAYLQIVPSLPWLKKIET